MLYIFQKHPIGLKRFFDNYQMRSKLILLFTIVLSETPVLTAVGQSINTDSLEVILKTKKLGAADKMDLYYRLGEAFVKTDFEKSKSYARQGLELAGQSDNSKMKGNFFNSIGAVYLMSNHYDSASFYISKAKKIGEELKDERLVTMALLKEATLNTRMARYEEALGKFFKALSYFERSGDKKNVRLVTSNIAALYMYQENFAHAEEYYRAALNMSLQLNDGSGLGQSYEGLSRIFMKKEKYDSSMHHAKLAASAFASINEKAFESVATQQIALSYLKTGQLANAEIYARKALELAKIPNSSRYVADATGLLSEIAFYKKDYPAAKKYALQALQIDSSDAETKSRMLYYLVRTNIYTGNIKEASIFLDAYKNAIDARAGENFQRSLSEMEVKYETEKKELRIMAMQKEKRLGITLSIAGALLALAFIALLFFRQRITKHKEVIAEQKIVQLEKEKQLVATQSILDGETAERTRLARDLHDGLGGMLSVIKLNLYDVKKGIHLDSNEVIHFNQALEMLETSTKELRRVAHNMMPESLSRFGLKTSLDDFIRNIPGAHFHYFGNDQRLNPKLEVMVYRIAYELVNNAIKHADADSINVQLVQRPDSISLTVQDDGRGFDVDEIADGSGLQNIKSRVRSFNGFINIFSKPAEGTEVNVEFKTNPVA